MASLFVQKEALEVLIVLLSFKIYFKIIFNGVKILCGQNLNTQKCALVSK